MNYRLERVNSELQKAITLIIRERVKNPNVTEMVSVTSVSVSKDLKSARVYISLYGNKDNFKSTFDALVRCEGFIRHELSTEFSHLRTVPELRFLMDESAEYGSRIDSLIEEIKEHDGNRGN